MLTLSKFAKNSIQNRSVKDAWTEIWNNEDEMLRNVYRSNIKQLGFDLFMFVVAGNIIGLLLSGLLDDLKKKAKESRSIKDGFTAAAVNIALMSAKSSFSDFNALITVGNPTF